VGPSAGFDSLVKRETALPLSEMETRTVQPIAYFLHRIAATKCTQIINRDDTPIIANSRVTVSCMRHSAVSTAHDCGAVDVTELCMAMSSVTRRFAP
jgi:hypothetical protein